MSYVVKGWCPGALRPMMSGDGLVVRVRPRMARLTADQAQGLALASMAHGSGVIDLTARSNLQLRGVRAEAHLALLDDLDRLGLLDADQAVERLRNVVVSPFWTEGDGTAEVVAEVTRVLAMPEFAGLPGKFGVSVDPGVPVLQAVSSDVRIERQGSDWLVRADGFETGALVQSVGDAVHRLLRWFLAEGVAEGRGRMRTLAGRALPIGFGHPAAWSGYQPVYGAHGLGQMVGFAFGQMAAGALLNLANNPLRITPWRMILIEGMKMAPSLPNVITDASDVRNRVTACTGAPGCPQGLQATRPLASRLAPLVPVGRHLHVSGCAKGCAQPGVADVTLTATSTGWELLRNGRAADPADCVFDSKTNPFKVL